MEQLRSGDSAAMTEVFRYFDIFCCFLNKYSVLMLVIKSEPNNIDLQGLPHPRVS